MSLSEKSEVVPSCEFQDNLNILRETYFFSGLPLETLKIIAYLCTREKFKQGEYLFRQNEDDGQALYIIDGTASLERENDNGIKALRDCKAGEFLGGLALLGNMRRRFSLKAISQTNCLILNREKFAKAMEQFPDLMSKICQAVVRAINNWEERFLTEGAEKCDECLERTGVSVI